MVCSQVTQSAKIHDYMRVCKLIINENFFLDKVHVVRRSSGFNFSLISGFNFYHFLSKKACKNQIRFDSTENKASLELLL